MKDDLLELWKHRELLKVFVQRDIRVRYKQSILGFMWAILMPLLIVAVGVIVRYAYSLASGAPMELSDVVGLAIRSVPWALTVSSIRLATNSLIGNGALVTKIYFPKEVFPLAAVGSSLFDSLIATLPLMLMVVFGGGQLSLQLFWVPVLVVVLLAMITGVAFVVSAASLFFRDVKYLVEVGLTFGIFVTPVFFNVAMFGRYGTYMMLNPVASILEGLDATVLHREGPPLDWVGYSAVLALVLLVGGYRLFKRMEPAFAESL
jgi:homopolymeric O-antigen transport system permease protein